MGLGREDLARGAAVAAGYGVLVWLTWRLVRKARDHEGQQSPPQAKPSLPLLGNALAYKVDPAGFLDKQREALGPCFGMNLAGLRMTVVAGRNELMQVANVGEATLSAQAATADFGFHDTLGPLNVCFGTTLMRWVLKNSAAFADAVEPPQPRADASGPGRAGSKGRAAGAGSVGTLEWAVIEAVRAQLCCQPGAVGRLEDAMAAVRRMTLHAVILQMLGEGLLRRYNAKGGDFLTEFMLFQDELEEATAKGVTLPAWLSRLAVWRRTRKERSRIAGVLSQAVAEVWASGEPMGPWLESVRGLPNRTDIGAWRQYLQRHGGRVPGVKAEGPIDSDEAAQLIIGLLFAAHKNPAIGAGQTLLMLLEHPEELKKVLEEVRLSPTVCLRRKWLQHSISETLRLTAHSIGGIRKVVAKEGFDVTAADGGRLHVPCGDYFALSHTAPNRNPDTFPDPLTWTPSRFAGPRQFDEYEFTTFSHGLHQCPGRRYAMRLMELLLVEMLRHFDWALVRPLPPVSYERATLAQRAAPCPLEYAPAVEHAAPAA